MSPQITVIVPVYNAEAYLKQSIDSILSQSFSDFELLLVDDGSKDSSPVICDTYAQADSRIKVIHKKNGGVSSARNLGLDQAQGKWITFVDADDWLEPGFFEIPSRYPNSDLIVCNHKEHYLDGHTKSVDFKKNEYISNMVIDHLNDHIREFVFKAPWSKFFKRELIEQHNIRFEERLSFAEDTLFNFNCYQHLENFACVKDSHYVYRALGVPAYRKYGVKPETIIVLLEGLFSIYFKMGLHNPGFERTYLWHYTMWENYFFKNGTEEERLAYYQHPLQKRLEADALELFRPWDRCMYRICKHRAYYLLKQFKKYYFKLRLGKEISL